jgi:hypothetical protein
MTTTTEASEALAGLSSEPIHQPSTSTGLKSAIRTERGLMAAATSLVALHVADDSFFQPASGTSALDHLAGGLIPIVALALGAWAYPRVRSGAASLIAIFSGLFGILIGVSEAGYYTVKVGPSGDDYSGLLAVPAGVFLVGLGLWTVWKSRKLDTWWRRYIRRALISVAAVVIAFEAVFPVALTYATTHAARAVVPSADLGTAHDDVQFQTSDGLTLYGWYIPSKNGAAIIDFPGRKPLTQSHARMYAKHGYGVLLFDRRGEGRSDGESNMFGWGGEKDINAAVDFLKTRSDVDPRRIGGIGFSVGGEMLLEAAAGNADLAAVVSEGAGTRSFKEEIQEIHGTDLALGYPFLIAKTAGTALFSNTMPPEPLTTLVPRIAPRPVFLIWTPVSGVETMNPVYQRLAGEAVSIWEIPEAKHIQGINTRPQEYEQRVIGFFDQALLGK